MSDIQTLMRSANPIEDPRTEFGPDDLDALLLLTQRRSGDMDVKEVTTPVTPEEKSNRGWLVAAVAFASIIAVVALAVLLSRPAEEVEPAAPTTTIDAAPPTTAGPTTTVVAEPTVSADDQAVLDGLVSALNTGDVEAFRSLFDPGAVREGEWASSYDDDVDGLVLEAQQRFARDATHTLAECRPTGERVNCKLVTEGPVELAIFQVPVRETYSFLIQDGRILHIDAKCDVCSDGAETDGQIRNWVAQFNPEAFSVMGRYHAEPSTVEGAVLWLKYAPLWRQAERGNVLDEAAEAMSAITAYEASWNAGDVDGFGAVIAVDAQRSELVNDVELLSDRDALIAEMAAYVAQGASIDVHSCTFADESIQCTITTSGPVVEALVFRSKTDTATFTVVEGVITRLGWVCRDCLIGMDTEADLVRWMRSQYPDEAETLGTTVVGLRDPVIAARWAEIAQEWIDAGRP